MKWQSLAVALTACVLLLAGGASLAAQTYSVTDLGELGSLGLDSRAYGLNDSGEVVGYSHLPGPVGFPRHAFRWKTYFMVDLGLLVPEGRSWARAVNEAGMVAGLATGNSGFDQPAVWRWPGNQIVALPTASSMGEARSLNNRGEIVGWVRGESTTFRATYWAHQGALPLDLGTVTGVGGGIAEAASDHSEVVGWSNINGACGGFIGPAATVWMPSTSGWTAMELINPSGFCFSHAWDINERHEAVGEYGGISSRNAVLWKYQHGIWLPYPLPTLTSGPSVARSINNRAQIVGENDQRAVLWQCDQILDLNDHIPASSGWVLSSAQAINDLGMIAAVGRRNGGITRAVLLKPLSDEPCCPSPGAK